MFNLRFNCSVDFSDCLFTSWSSKLPISSFFIVPLFIYGFHSKKSLVTVGIFCRPLFPLELILCPYRVVLSLYLPGVTEGYVRSSRLNSLCLAEQKLRIHTRAQWDWESPTRKQAAKAQPAPHMPALPLAWAEVLGPVFPSFQGPNECVSMCAGGFWARTLCSSRLLSSMTDRTQVPVINSQITTAGAPEFMMTFQFSLLSCYLVISFSLKLGLFKL